MTSVLPLRLLALYAADRVVLFRELGLLDAEPSTANVVIAEPQDDEILPSAGDPATLVAPVALVLADLLSLPGRSDAEADQLMDAFSASTETSWKE